MDPQQLLAETIFDVAGRIDDNRRGHFVAELALFTLLIDAGLVTIEQACNRLESIQAALDEQYHSDAITFRLLWLNQWLRGHKQPNQHDWAPAVIDGGRDWD